MMHQHLRAPHRRARPAGLHAIFADGHLRVTYKDRVLVLTAYGTYPVPDAKVDEKTLNARRLRRPAARLRGLTPPHQREACIDADDADLCRLRNEGTSLLGEPGDILMLR